MLIWKIAFGFCLFFLAILSIGFPIAVIESIGQKAISRSLIGGGSVLVAWTGFTFGIYAFFWDWEAARYAWICFGTIIANTWLVIAAQAVVHFHKSTPRGLILNELREDGTLPQLVQLVEFIRKSDLDARRDYLARTTTTLRRFSEELDVDQRYLFDRMLTMLARSVDAPARASLASALATLVHAPRGITRVLAYDNDITVAGPILRASTCIDESDLIAIVRTKTPEHVREIATRRHMGTTLSYAIRSQNLGKKESSANNSASTPRSAHLGPEVRLLLMLLLWAAISSLGIGLIWLRWDAVTKVVELWSIDQNGLAYLLVGACALIVGGRIYRAANRMTWIPRVSHNRAIARIGWISLGAGTILLATLGFRVAAVLVWDNPIADFEALAWAIGTCFGSVFLKWGGMTVLNTKFVPLATDILITDHRPPVLYLRTFARELAGQSFAGRFDSPLRRFAEIRRIGKVLRENRRNEKHLMEGMSKELEDMTNRNSISGALSLTNLGQTLSSGRGSTFDEQLVIANLMNRIGPYIAFGRSTETFRWADVGAAKLYVSESKWHDRVSELIDEAAAIVIEGGASEGLAWEIGDVVRRSIPIKLLVVLPSTDEGYMEFLRQVGHLFPMPLPVKRPPSRLLSFSEHWRPIVLEAPTIDDLTEDFRANTLSLVIRPFLRQNAFELTPSRLLRDKIMSWARLHFEEEPQLGSS